MAEVRLVAVGLNVDVLGTVAVSDAVLFPTLVLPL